MECNFPVEFAFAIMMSCKGTFDATHQKTFGYLRLIFMEIYIYSLKIKKFILPGFANILLKNAQGLSTNHPSKQ